MMKKDIKTRKEKKKAERRAEDIKLYRLMVEFVLAVVMVLGVISLAKANQIYIAQNVMPIVCVATGILFAAAAIGFILVKRKGTNESGKIITSAGVFGNAAVLFFASAHYYLFCDIKQLALSIVIVSLLYFVYSIYGGPFYRYSLSTAAGFLALSVAMIDNSAVISLATLLMKGAYLLAYVIPVLSIVLVIIGKAKRKVSTNLTVSVIISSLIILAGAVLFILDPAAVVYSIFALLAYYLVTTVVYTVKMM